MHVAEVDAAPVVHHVGRSEAVLAALARDLLPGVTPRAAAGAARAVVDRVAVPILADAVCGGVAVVVAVVEGHGTIQPDPELGSGGQLRLTVVALVLVQVGVDG